MQPVTFNWYHWLISFNDLWHLTFVIYIFESSSKQKTTVLFHQNISPEVGGSYWLDLTIICLQLSPFRLEAEVHFFWCIKLLSWLRPNIFIFGLINWLTHQSFDNNIIIIIIYINWGPNKQRVRVFLFFSVVSCDILIRNSSVFDIRIG